MSDPKRYAPSEKYIGSGDYIGCMEAAEDGDYVDWTDYVALRQQVADANQLLDERDGLIGLLRETKAERDALKALLRNMVELAEYWINRNYMRQISEQEWRTWHALGHGSKAMMEARAAIAEKESGR